MTVYEEQFHRLLAHDRDNLLAFMADSGYTPEMVLQQLAGVPRVPITFEQPFWHEYFREEVIIRDGVLLGMDGHPCLYDFYGPVLVRKLVCSRDEAHPDWATLYFNLTYAFWEERFKIEISDDMDIACPADYRGKQPARYQLYRDLWLAFDGHRELLAYDSRKK